MRESGANLPDRLARDLHYNPLDAHNMNHPLTALASLVAVLIAGTATPQQAANTAPTVKVVMNTMTVPASDAIFAAASEPPKEAAQWVALRASAKALADSGRQLTTTTPGKNDPEWIAMARALVTNAETTLESIDAKDMDALSNAGDQVYVTCKTCHDRYMRQ
jgi:cytochrome c556